VLLLADLILCRLAILPKIVYTSTMTTTDREMASADSIRSSSASEKSLKRAVSEIDLAVNHEDPEKDAVPGILSTGLRTVSSKNAASIRTTGTNNPDFEVDWDDEDDPMNPRNWPVWYKGLTIFFISWSTWCVVMYSTSYTTGLAQMQADFHISSEPVVTLGVTSYRKFVWIPRLGHRC